MATMERRKFLQSTLALSALTVTDFQSESMAHSRNELSNRFKISLNAYSFNVPLRSGKINLEDVIEFSAVQGFDAVDLTGYYFPGYPAVASDEYIFRLKRKAHQLGVAISGTGIRNEFAQPDKIARAGELLFIKNWIEVAAKLGAPVIRIFTKKLMPENATRETVTDQVLEDLRVCVEYGQNNGVIVAIQNHNDFILTADQVIDLIKRVNSEWIGLVLDTGSFVTYEPYSEIAKAAPYAVNWQIKEKLNYKGKIEDMDLIKLFQIIKASTYRGYLPIETLSPGDPFVIIPPFLKEVKLAMASVFKN
jgi:sugar phosphate isomerase/epimerase